uniref:NADH:ubiquinone reductase (H(+)-translocating) n=1 Tax=Trichuris suis TaxID=68888 RepID=A0A0M4REG8_9BILA|nr:NADH dehydrogenase subunit 5 [Trichuris suis]
MYLVKIYCISLFFLFMLMSLMLKGNISFLTLSFNNFISDISFTWSSKLMIYFTAIVLVLSFFIFLFSSFYMSEDIPINRFMAMMLFFIVSMLIVNNGNSCWTVWLGWEGLGISSYFLIMYYNNWKANNSAVVTIMLNRMGDFCLLISLLMFTQVLTWTLENFSLSPLFIMLISLATITKSAQLPFSSWLPIAMAAPTPVSSLVHSSTLVVAGTILCIKFSAYYFFPYMIWLCLLGYITSLYSSMMAFLEKDLKKILAYSTMSQIALVLFMLCTNLKELMLMHIINHALASAWLFMNIGIYIVFMFSNQDTRILYHGSMLLPVITSSVICLMVMCGITFTSSYYSKEYSLLFVMKEDTITFMVNMMIFLSFAYSSRMIYLFTFSGSNTMMPSKIYYPYIFLNNMITPLMIFNGWIFTNNYSLPLNLSWTSNKSWVLIFPVMILIFCYKIISAQMLNNNDLVYSLMNNSVMYMKYMADSMIKFATLSLNFNLLSFSNMSLTSILLGTMMILLYLNFMYFL